jgi:hypothetical protein
MSWGVTEQTILARAERQIVVGALAGLNARPPWLSPGHPFPDGSIPNVSALQRMSLPHVAETLAARGPLHCADGWGYLGRAIAALIAGDGHAVRHLAYYAELRAALSILSSQGIGVFNGLNFVVDATGAPQVIPRRQGTHVDCWNAISAWASLPGASEALAGSIDIGGMSLWEGMQEFFASPSSTAVGSQLIQEWGFDLNFGARDRRTRNLASYNPNALSAAPLTVHDDVVFVRAFWECFEPSIYMLERHMLRKMLEMEQRGIDPLNGAAHLSRYGRIDQRLQSAVTLDFLQRQEDGADSLLLTEAADATFPGLPRPMIARAGLLLRLATSMAQRNMREASLSFDPQLTPWWAALGEERGFWAAGDPPEEFDELWSDVEVAIEEVDGVDRSNRRVWLLALPSSAQRLSESERVVLWNFS